jgi:hypothetical protein
MTTSMLDLPIEIACVLKVFLARPVIYVLHDDGFLLFLSYIFALVKETG